MTEELLANAYIKGASDLLQGKIEGMPKIVVIPDNATNGDMIKAMFPNAKYFKGVNHCNRDEDGNPKQCMYMSIIGVIYHPFPIDWWNAPYKAESEDKE